MKILPSILLTALLASRVLAQSDQQLADYFKRHPEADANRDGTLTRQEARSHRQGNPSRGDNLESNSRIPGIDVSPGDSPVEEIVLHSPDGVDLSFAYRKPKGEGPFPTILFFHGGGGKSNLQGLKNNLLTSPIQTRFLARGYLTVQSTRRPFWKTPGEDSPTGFYDAVADAARVVNKVKTLPGADPDRIILYGGSGGGILAIVTASRVEVSCVIAGEPATVVPIDPKPDVVGGGAGAYREIMEDPRAFYTSGRQKEIRAWMKKIPCPILVLQGEPAGLYKTNFEILIPEMEALGKDISSLTYPGKTHGFYWGSTRTGATLETVEKIMRDVTGFIEKKSN